MVKRPPFSLTGNHSLQNYIASWRSGTQPMTLIAKISATTAGYAADAIRQPRRISSVAQAEDIRLDADRNTKRAETGDPTTDPLIQAARSEERRVGKECVRPGRSRGSPSTK